MSWKLPSQIAKGPGAGNNVDTAARTAVQPLHSPLADHSLASTSNGRANKTVRECHVHTFEASSARASDTSCPWAKMPQQKDPTLTNL